MFSKVVRSSIVRLREMSPTLPPVPSTLRWAGKPFTLSVLFASMTIIGLVAGLRGVHAQLGAQSGAPALPQKAATPVAPTRTPTPRPPALGAAATPTPPPPDYSKIGNALVGY